ncbi:O-antigen polymerase [Aliarcobacter butzleri]|uniref:O-antigen polymerase n=1 Tax=Aliarcobacter butzleri TaxID=28197 RepID=UPI00189CB81F|nr:O-antigen polymerase [Aliarcobacter butzleri]MBF7071676.1 hypothetical protein [Aliarcobacter butzleri]
MTKYKNTVLSKNIYLEFIFAIVLKLVLDYAYIYITLKVNIDGFYHGNFYLFNYLIGWILALNIFLFLEYKKDIKIYPIFLMLYVFYILPNIVYYSFENLSLKFLIFILAPYIVILLLVKNFDLKIDNKLKLNVDIKYLIYFSIIFALVTLFHLIWTTNGDFVLDFRKVYQFREKYDISNNGIWGYLNNWVKIFVLFLFAYALYTKRYFLAVFSILIMFSFYIFTGNKSTFVSLFIVLFFYILYKIKWNTSTILFFFIFLFGSIVIFAKTTGEIWLISIAIRRALYVPAVLNFAYFEFFSKNEFIYWSNSILKYFFEYPYDKNFPFLIGEYLKKPDTYANTGFIAVSFAHAGLWGIVFYTILASVIMNIINYFIVDKMKFIQFSIILLPIFTFFTVTDLTTTILTHGLLVSILLIIFIYSTKDNFKCVE